MATTLGDSTSAGSAAKALGVSRRTVNRYLADNRLEDAGLGPDGERRVTLASLTRVKAELDDQRAAGIHDTPDEASPVAEGGILLTRAMAMLEEELRARRDEAERARETLLITERSTATLQAERDQLRLERDQLKVEADRVRHALATVTAGGPFSRWKARRDLASELASL